MLGRALKMAFWVTYDHLGKLILASVLWSFAVCAPSSLAFGALLTRDVGIRLVVGVPLLILALGVAAPVATAGLAHMAKELIETRDGSVRAMITGMRLYGRRAAGLGLLYLVALTCLATSVLFYTTMMRDSVPWIGYALSGLALWCLVFVALTACLVLPTLVQKKAGTWQTLRLTALLVLDNPLFSIGLAIQVLALTTMVFLPPLFFCLYGASVVVLVSSAYEQLARKYAAIEYEGRTGDKPCRLNKLAVQGRDGVALIDEEDDDYLNRGFRDFLFPWKG